MRIAVTGATGFIGRRLLTALRARGDEVTAFSRDAARAKATLPGDVRVLPLASLSPEVLAQVDAVVHLAGEPVTSGRWTEARKRAIHDSRVSTTRAVVEALAGASPRPRALVSVSGVGYYGHTGDEEVTESSPPGGDFLAGVCVDWEAEARRAEAHGVRVAVLRVGVVLGDGGGALEKMLPAFKMWAGGPVGDGAQWFPWVHADDVVAMLCFALDRADAPPVMNAVAPEPVRFDGFARALGEALGRPSWLRVPGFALRLALGEMAEALLTGQRALPRAALDAGFTFRHPSLRGALADALAARRGPTSSAA